MLWYTNYDCINLLWKYDFVTWAIPDSKVQGAHMGPTWGRQDPGGPHVGHGNLAIWDDKGVSLTMLMWVEINRLRPWLCNGVCTLYTYKSVYIPRYTGQHRYEYIRMLTRETLTTRLLNHPLLLLNRDPSTDKNIWTRTKMRTWMINHFCTKSWDVIIHLCLNFNGSQAKLPLNACNYVYIT